jgi:NADH-quinone oxidoreductase subunit L
MEILVLLILVPPLAGAALNGIFGRRFPNWLVSLIACGASGLSAVFAFLSAFAFSQASPQEAPFVHNYFTWLEAGAFRADFALWYDRLTLVMTVTVTFVAFLIHL